MAAFLGLVRICFSIFVTLLEEINHMNLDISVNYRFQQNRRGFELLMLYQAYVQYLYTV